MKGDQNKLLEDIFTVSAIDPNNKTPFRNVSRIHLTSQYKLSIQLDINSQIYPVTMQSKLFLKMINSQNTRNAYTKEELAKIPEKDNFQYVMYGVVFEIEDNSSTTESEMTVYISFGGLIMKIKGKKTVLAGFRKDGSQSRVYLMIRKA